MALAIEFPYPYSVVLHSHLTIISVQCVHPVCVRCVSGLEGTNRLGYILIMNFITITPKIAGQLIRHIPTNSCEIPVNCIRIFLSDAVSKNTINNTVPVVIPATVASDPHR
jgi:hypothetical protein